VPAAGGSGVGSGVTSGVGEYWQLSRSLTYSVALALPLLVLYELGARLIAASGGPPVRNAADVMLRGLLRSAGIDSTLSLSVLLVVLGVLLAAREQRAHPLALRPRVAGLMLAESAFLASVFGAAVGLITGLFLPRLAAAWPAGEAPGASVVAAAAGSGLAAWQQLVLSLGAGLYEELLFRVLLIPALALGMQVFLRTDRGPAWATAAVASALLFSLAHYVGPYGDPLSAGTFLFRFFGGLMFSLILVLRGFGIVVWTHALYDVFLVLAQSG